MTDEQKKVEECKNCECCKMVCKFFFLSGAVFLGTLMALLLAHALLKPSCPPCHGKMMRFHRPGIERQMPPRMFEHQGQRPDFGNYGPKHFSKSQRPDAQRPDLPKAENRPFKLEAAKN